MPEFKFAIGEILKPVVGKNSRFQVVQRLAVECTGGVQLYYDGRLYCAFHCDTKMTRFHEMELERASSNEDVL